MRSLELFFYDYPLAVAGFVFVGFVACVGGWIMTVGGDE